MKHNKLAWFLLTFVIAGVLVFRAGLASAYVMEAAIPLSYMGITADTLQDISIHWTQECGNDNLVLNADINPYPVPEPSSLILFGSSIVGLLIAFVRRRFLEAKRIFDIAASLVGLAITAPLIVFLGILIKLDSRGSILYKQERVGENRRMQDERRKQEFSFDNSRRDGQRRREKSLGRIFTMYKLRTMNFDAESETGAVWAQENDPRVTRIGRALRKAHLDELPQLINVLKGEMSLIGPRPERPQIIENIKEDVPNYESRLSIKPGITGLAQVRCRYDSTLKDVKNKLRYDMLYKRKMGMLWDVRVILLTALKIMTGKVIR